MATPVEICGDERLGAATRLAYLWKNAWRNLLGGGPPVDLVHFLPERVAGLAGTASPSRALTEAFLALRLPELMPPGEVSVLEIGCGSGSLVRRLASFGYRGRYLGIDVGDRFDRREVDGFTRDFRCMDASDFDPGNERFDLIVSVSALEHIPDESALVARLPAMLAPGGLELHFVPSGWGLVVYLWHGYRQYTRRRIGATFGTAGCRVHALGGLPSFVVHGLAITLGEMLLGLKPRQRLAGSFRRLRDTALAADRFLPVCPTVFVVERRNPAPRRDAGPEMR